VTSLGSPDFWKRLADEPARLAAEVCFIDVANLEQTLYKHAALYAWVCASHEVARIAEERLRWEVTKARARALMRARETEERKTVQSIAAEVELDETVQETTEDLLSAQDKRGALRAMVDALEHRKDMLLQISAKQRQEAGLYNR
jgi:hypothetical protein